MKAKELRENTIEELAVKRRELKEESLNLRIQQQTGQLENPARLKLVRRDIARIETLINEKKRAAAT
ncbi:MAG: 50S ribosomal protein L29 [Verrucomicrobiota bacterium]